PYSQWTERRPQRPPSPNGTARSPPDTRLAQSAADVNTECLRNGSTRPSQEIVVDFQSQGPVATDHETVLGVLETSGRFVGFIRATQPDVSGFGNEARIHGGVHAHGVARYAVLALELRSQCRDRFDLPVSATAHHLFNDPAIRAR